MIEFSLCANFPWRILLRWVLLKFDKDCNNLEWKANALVKWNFEENLFLYQIHTIISGFSEFFSLYARLSDLQYNPDLV